VNIETQMHGARDLVDVLASRALRPHGRYLDFFGTDLVHDVAPLDGSRYTRP
jgi:hypothetical protein